jgi:16S rRNA (guanine966-N2)-methyltransferase
MPRPIKPVATPRPPAPKLRHAPQQVRIIGGEWKRTPLPVTAIDGLRPTPDRVRETLFNWLGQTLDGLHCLDLFAGTGALGFEAASRGAGRVVLVERHPRAATQLRATKDKLDATAVEIVEADAIRFAANLPPASFDVVFLDPPFDSGLLGNALKLTMPLVAPGGVLYVEASVPIDLAMAAMRETAPEVLARTAKGIKKSAKKEALKAANEAATEAAKEADTCADAQAEQDVPAEGAGDAAKHAAQGSLEGVTAAGAQAAVEGAVEDVAKQAVKDPAGDLPPGWSLDRHGKAGLVHYHLLRREID